MIDQAGEDESLVMEFTLGNYPVEDYSEESPDEVTAFTTVLSLFYPEVTVHYERLVHWWYTERRS
ncbi:MAG: hypothetical protein H0T83_05130 [Chthoniobacterales bacterium]|nr:hypothetical protein [Chthoniobacterales bacterium]